MAQPLCAPLSESWIPSPAGRQPPMPSDGDNVCSPAWSSDSWDSAQASSPAPPSSRPPRRAGTPGRRGTHGSRLGSGQRQSASEREKLRMRTLARALHELRRFLPPSVAPTGQNLTKIETLRLAIRYIGHLSAVLGLSEDSLQRQRHAVSPRGCPLCHDGGLAQAQSLSPHLSPAACSGVSWGSPPAYPRPRVAAESWDPSFLYAETASQERQEMELSPSSPVSNPFSLCRGGAPYCWCATHSPTSRTSLSAGRRIFLVSIPSCSRCLNGVGGGQAGVMDALLARSEEGVDECGPDTGVGVYCGAVNSFCSSSAAICWLC